MLDITKVEEESIWKIVKKTRRSFVVQHPNPYSCQDYQSKKLLANEYIQENIDSLEKELKLNTSMISHKNVSFKTLETAGEMFTYLNYCSLLIPKYLRIIAHLFQTGTPREIIFGLISVIKTSKNLDEKYKTIEILSKFMETFWLETQYKKVQIITKGKCYTNGTFDDCTKKKNLTDEEYQNILGCLWYLSSLFNNTFLLRIPSASKDDKSSCSHSFSK